MKRGGPLQRHTALASGLPPQRRTPLAPGKPIPGSSLPLQGSNGSGVDGKDTPAQRKAQRRRSGLSVPADVWALVQARDGGCVVGRLCTGRWDVALVPGHRRNRGMGGSKDPALSRPSALITNCTLDNGWLEDAPALAYEAGWKARDGVTPLTEVPVRFPGGSWWLLDDEGGRTEVTRWA